MHGRKRRGIKQAAYLILGAGILAAPCSAMPGGFGGGGFFAILLAYLGMVAGYVILVIKAAYESVRHGPNRARWRLLLLILLSLGLVWFGPSLLRHT